MSPYEVLGLKKSATDAQIKSAYRKASATAHPDKGGSAEDFRAIKEAYDILRDPARRERYDSTGRTRPSPVTEAKIREAYRHIMKRVVSAVDMDDPTRANIKAKMVKTLQVERRGIVDLKYGTQRRLERATRLWERFDTGEEFDPIREALRNEMEEARSEMAHQEDQIEISEELERVLKTYEYNTDPQPEGQHDWGPGTVRVVQLGGFGSSSSTGG